MPRCLLSAAVAAAFCVTGVGAAHAEPITRYDQLREQLFTGVAIAAIFRPEECQTDQRHEGDATRPQVEGGFFIRDFMEVQGNKLAFANPHFTVRSDGTPVFEFLQYRVMADNSATVTLRHLSPVTYLPLPESKPIVYQCAIGQGVSFKRVHPRT
jgi:hypothetical protein